MTGSHTWKFFRAGGFDQVQLDSGADLLALKELDQKLWVALGCPTRGIEFDSKTLDLIDGDGDGHVRASDVLAAIEWAGRLLKNADLLVNEADSLTLDAIDDSSEEGRQVLASARHIVKSLGKPDETAISLSDLADIEKFVAGLEFNGDGVICAVQVEDAGLRAVIEDMIKCCGAAADLSGGAGINREIADRFFAESAVFSAWQTQGESDASILLLGEKTMSAAEAFQAVREKISDYFTRCRLAAFDPRAAIPLSRSIEDYHRLAAQNLSAQSQEVANFPLATVEPDKALPLRTGINPAWQDRLDSLRELVVAPLLGNRESLSAADWDELCASFAAFEAWQAGKPSSRVEQLGIARIREILGGSYQSELDGLMAQDKAVEAEVKATRLVEKLLRYNRDLFRLVNNFVSFRNFYTGRDKAIFQVGTLYLDGRSCELCVRVDDIARHAGLAGMSGICLAYCDCVRNRGAEKMSIAAAFTAGDSDYLMAGRNGIFYDRKGQDWDASVVRIVEHPISIRQAFWSPYRKLARVIAEQLEKLAASRISPVDDKLLKAAIESSKQATPRPAFDVGKFAGIFAAIGLAIGAIGGILASIVSGVLGLKFWQIPLALAGLLLLISGPSMAMAWFKLKRRNLAPILDANGWAINARVRINIPFGTSLTGLAELPEGANRSLNDPFAEKRLIWPYYLAIAAGICSLVVLWYMGFFGHR